MNNLAWMLAGAAVVMLLWLVVRLLGSSDVSGRSLARSRRLTGTDATDLAELTRDRRRSTAIIETMAEGVLVLNEALTPVLANSAARSLLALPEVSLPMTLSSEEIVAVARDALDGDAAQEEIVKVWFPERMALRVHAAPLEDRGVVVVLEDVSQELLAQRIRSEFVASASHELKSPVASIQALGEALQEAAREDPETTVRFARQIVQETQRMSRLISDLLDLSRLEEAMDAPREMADVSKIAQEVEGALSELAEEANVELAADLQPGVVVRGDSRQLALMVRNLIDNAVRYTPAGGTIVLRVRREGTRAIVEVSDTGVGIPQEAQERVFERFYRVDPARARDSGGTGLGLAIVKHAVELHGGVISLRSEVGRGTTFTITLPAADPQEPRLQPVAS